MKSKFRRAIALTALGVMLSGAVAAPALAAPDPKSAKCNSGRGNLSETDLANDCDPGNSGGNNQGGD